jgi:hypothetical protein
MYKTIFEGDALSAEGQSLIDALYLTEHQSMGFIPSDETPRGIKIYNIPGRLNDMEYDHLLIIKRWSGD